MSKSENSPRSGVEATLNQARRINAQRSPQQAESEARRFVHGATVESFGVAEMMIAYNTGLRLLGTHNSNAGVAILRGLEGYFKDSVLVTKYIDAQDAKQLSMSAQLAVQAYEGQQRVAHQRDLLDPYYYSPSLYNIATQISTQKVDLKEAFSKGVPYAIVTIPVQDIPQAEKEQLLPKYSRLTNDIRNFNATDWSQQSLPIDLYQSAVEISRLKGGKYENPLSKSYNGVRVTDLQTPREYKELTDEDINGLQFLNFAAGTTNGSAFWKEWKEAVIFHPINEVTLHEVRETPFGKNVFRFQKWLAEQLMVPALTNGTIDANVAQMLQQSIRGMRPRELAKVGLALYTALKYSGYFIATSESEAMSADGKLVGSAVDTTQKIVRKSPLFPMALEHMRTQYGGQFYLFDEAVHRLIHDNAETVRATLKKQLPGAHRLIDIIADTFGFDYAQHHKESIMEAIEKEFGRDFIAKVDHRAADLGDVTRQVLEVVSQANKPYLLHPDVENIIDFSQSTLPALMGFQRIGFVARDTTDNIGFYILLNSQITFQGEINLQNGVENMSIDIAKEHPGIDMLIKQIAVVAFHDLISAKEIERKKLDSKSQTDSNIDQDEEIEGTTKRKKTIVRWLPRLRKKATIQEASLDDIERTDIHTSDELQHTIRENLRERHIEPHAVDIHLRGVPYASAYEQLVTQYNKATDPELRARLAVQLQGARAKLYTPSASKIASLPLRYKSDDLALVDPLTGETVYTRTWVVAHTNPKLTDEERKSAVKVYERHYRPNGDSALAYLNNVILPWVVESVSTNE